MENEQLFELMTKMYGEMQEGFKEVNFRIDSLESEVKDIKTELEEFRKETNERFDSLENKLNELEITNATNHITNNTRLNKISEDLDFLTHKEFQTEKEMFHLKQRLNKRKRNTK